LDATWRWDPPVSPSSPSSLLFLSPSTSPLSYPTLLTLRRPPPFPRTPLQLTRPAARARGGARARLACSAPLPDAATEAPSPPSLPSPSPAPLHGGSSRGGAGRSGGRRPPLLPPRRAGGRGAAAASPAPGRGATAAGSARLPGALPSRTPPPRAPVACTRRSRRAAGSARHPARGRTARHGASRGWRRHLHAPAAAGGRSCRGARAAGAGGGAPASRAGCAWRTLP